MYQYEKYIIALKYTNIEILNHKHQLSQKKSRFKVEIKIGNNIYERLRKRNPLCNRCILGHHTGREC